MHSLYIYFFFSLHILLFPLFFFHSLLLFSFLRRFSTFLPLLFLFPHPFSFLPFCLFLVISHVFHPCLLIGCQSCPVVRIHSFTTDHFRSRCQRRDILSLHLARMSPWKRRKAFAKQKTAMSEESETFSQPA